jgi:hypothetical protein
MQRFQLGDLRGELIDALLLIGEPASQLAALGAKLGGLMFDLSPEGGQLTQR